MATLPAHLLAPWLQSENDQLRSEIKQLRWEKAMADVQIERGNRELRITRARWMLQDVSGSMNRCKQMMNAKDYISLRRFVGDARDVITNMDTRQWRNDARNKYAIVVDELGALEDLQSRGTYKKDRRLFFATIARVVAATGECVNALELDEYSAAPVAEEESASEQKEDAVRPSNSYASPGEVYHQGRLIHKTAEPALATENKEDPDDHIADKESVRADLQRALGELRDCRDALHKKDYGAFTDAVWGAISITYGLSTQPKCKLIQSELTLACVALDNLEILQKKKRYRKDRHLFSGNVKEAMRLMEVCMRIMSPSDIQKQVIAATNTKEEEKKDLDDHDADDEDFEGPQCIADLHYLIAIKMKLITGKEEHEDLEKLVADKKSASCADCIMDLVTMILYEKKVIAGMESWEELEKKLADAVPLK